METQEKHMDRITPAHAGKRSWQTPPGWAGGDHPRTRGEKWPMFSKLKPSSGSPPHTRGKGTLETQEKHMDRITPAHAGKRCAFPNVWEDVKDHPRTRGEKPTVNHADVVRWGSPPHTRGKECDGECAGEESGITPAHAGKSIIQAKISAR